MVQVNMQDAKTQLSQLVARAEHGESVVIARQGVPAVQLQPMAARSPRVLGFLTLELPDSFFEPLDEDELAAWER